MKKRGDAQPDRPRHRLPLSGSEWSIEEFDHGWRIYPPRGPHFLLSGRWKREQVEGIAAMMEAAYRRGVEDARREIRDALGIVDAGS